MTCIVGSRGVLGRISLGLLALVLALVIAPQVALAAPAEGLLSIASGDSIARVANLADGAERFDEVSDATETLPGDPAVRADDEDAATVAVETTATGNRALVPTACHYDEAFEVLRLVNQERARVGAQPLRMDADLLDDAMYRATETAIVFSHTRPDGSRCFTVDGNIRAENIAAGQRSAAEVMDSWMNSTGHRGNILNPAYSTIGIGCVVIDGVPFWAQEFGVGSNAADCLQPADETLLALIPVTSGPIRDTNSDEVYQLNPTLHASANLGLGVGQEEDLVFTQVNPGFPYMRVIFFGEGWTSSDPAVAALSETGVIGAGPGNATLTCQLGDFRYTVNVQVKDGVPVYRLYNPYTHEHLFTTDAGERDADVDAGWDDEGVEWFAPKSSSKPVYRLYNPFNGDHFYTTGLDEYNRLVRDGWRGEGTKFHSADSSGIPVYRLFNPYNHGAGAHHYTTSSAERDNLLGSGWKNENVGWYGIS